MIKSEPRSILQFLATHFDMLRELFDIQTSNEVITLNQVDNTLKNYESEVKIQLLEYKLLVPQNDDFIINEPYFVLFEFILQQFKPLLPEEIEKFGQSIRALFGKIKENNLDDINHLLAQIEALSKEINKFRTAVTNNTISLLNESRELKANTQKIDYQQKVHQARNWIENYIQPLNSILDVNHSQSIFNELLEISKYSNKKRFDNSIETLRTQFEKLYSLLRQVITDINKQSIILSNELLPLIERIKTESEYLKGFHNYLTNGNCWRKYEPPYVFTTTRDNLYNPFIYENTKNYFEQFKNEEDVIIVEEISENKQWFFERSVYKSKLESNLPVDDFFTWCEKSLKEEKDDFNFDNYFMITSLMFDEDFHIETQQEKITIKTKQGELIMPKLKIEKKEYELSK